MSNSISCVGAGLSRTFPITSPTGDLTYILAFKIPGSPDPGTYEGIFGLRSGSVGLVEGFTSPPDTDDSVFVEYKSPSVTTVTAALGTNTDLDGSWVHLVFTRNGTTGVQHVYACLEGVNQASPTFLVSTNAGTNALPTVVTIDALFADGEGDGSDGLLIAHAIIAQIELDQDQAVASMLQRAPIAAVTAVQYSYLDCTDSTNPGLDLGSTATNYSASGTYSPESSMPSDWGTGSVRITAASNAYVGLTNVTVLNAGSDFHVRGWYKVNSYATTFTQAFAFAKHGGGAYVGCDTDESGSSTTLDVYVGGVGQTFDYVSVATGSYSDWIFIAVTHVGGTNQYRVDYRKPGENSLTTHTLTTTTELVMASQDLFFGGDISDATDTSIYCCVADQTAPTTSEMLALSATVISTGAEVVFAPLTSIATAGTNEGTFGSLNVVGSLTDEPTVPHVSVITVSQGADGNAGNPDLTLTEPQSSGSDFTLVAVLAKDTSGPIGSTSGWTQLGHAETTWDGECFAVFTRDATGAGNSHTFALPGSDFGYRWGFLAALSGSGRTVTVSSAVMAAGVVDSGVSPPTALNAASVTTAGNNADLIWVAGEDRGTNFDPATFTRPSGWFALGTDQYNGRNSSGALATKFQSTVGATGGANGSATFATGQSATIAFIIIVEAASSSSTLIDVDAGTDTPAVTDSIVRSSSYARALSDTAAVTDSIYPTLVGKAYVLSASEAHNGTGTALSVTEPPDAAAGDLILVFAHCNNDTTIVDNNGSTPYDADSGDYHPSPANGLTMAVFSRRKQAGDPTTLNFTSGATGRWRAVSVAVRNPHPTTIYDVTPATGNQNDLTNTIDALSVTTTSARALHFVFCGFDGDGDFFTSTPSGYGVAFANVSGDGANSSAVVYKTIVSVGATGDQTFTADLADGCGCISLALKNFASGDVIDVNTFNYPHIFFTN